MYKILFALLLFFVLADDAHAYLDPGTGSLIIQMLIATVAGVVFALRFSWRKVCRVLLNIFSRKTKQKPLKND